MQPWPRQRSIDAGRPVAAAEHTARRTVDGQAAGGHSDRRGLWAFRDFVWRQMWGIFDSRRTAILGYLVQELVVGAPEETGRVKLLEEAVESVNDSCVYPRTD